MKINQRIGLIRRTKNLLPTQTRISLYNALILPPFGYGDAIWGDKNNDTIMSGLQILQKKTAKVGHPPRSSSNEVPLSTRRFFSSLHCYLQLYNWRKYNFNLNFVKNHAVHSYNTRCSNNLVWLLLTRTNWGKQPFTVYQPAKDWNSLPLEMKEPRFLTHF